MLNKKGGYYLLATAFSILIVIPLLFWGLSSIKKSTPPPTSPPLPTKLFPPKPTLPEKIVINDVQMNNFYKNSLYVDKASDVIFFEDEDFKITYLSQFNQFLISIKGSPFPELKTRAEEQFLRTLGISKKDACKLNVVTSTPRFANPEYSGTNYPLSFCSGE